MAFGVFTNALSGPGKLLRYKQRLVIAAFSNGRTSFNTSCLPVGFQLYCCKTEGVTIPSRYFSSAVRCCQSWKKPAIDYELSSVVGDLIPVISKSNVGVSSNIGRRQYNEDRYCVEMVEEADALIVGVFDGHGGEKAADYCAQHLPNIIRSHLLHPAGKSLDQEEHLYCGTTATVSVLVSGTHLYTAGVGDSRAVLCRKGKPLQLTIDHSPSSDSERARVEASGASVVSNSIGQLLVNGRLNMTRSLGDFDLKKCGVTAEPDVAFTKIKHHYDSFLVLVTDGVTHSLSNGEVLGIIQSCQSPQEAADRLTDESLQLCLDNCTVLVLPLGAWSEDSIGNYSFDNFGRMLKPKD